MGPMNGSRRNLASFGSVLPLLVAACAQTQSPSPTLEPPVQDASAEVSSDAPSDANGDAVHDAANDPDAADAPIDSADASSADAAPDVCVPFGESDAGEGPCSAGQVEREWCGACGRRQRFCGNDGAWKPWSDCLEDELAVCTQCEAAEVSCGFCGKRPVTCETSQQVCLWTLGACVQAGACAAGDYQADATGCDPGLVRVRWCTGACEWGPSGVCEKGPRWEPLPEAPIAPRRDFVSVVAADRWFIWGGLGASGYLDDGALFDPSSDAWEPIAAPAWDGADGGADAGGGAESFVGRSDVAAVWTGSEIVLFGGRGAGDAVSGVGARWAHATGWSAISTQGAPSARVGASAVWSPSAGRVIVWGGAGKYGAAAAGGGRYAPSDDAWSAVSNAPFAARVGHVAVWDGAHARMIVWGGADDDMGVPQRSGAAYDPVTDTWTPIADAPIRRRHAVAFWDAASSRMLVLMGEDGAWGGPRGDGAAYEPSTNRWEMLPDLALTGYAPGRGHTAVWGEGRVWAVGGDVAWAGGLTALGARYDSATDAWARIPPLAVARSGHRSVYAGALLVWGGGGGGERLVGVE